MNREAFIGELGIEVRTLEIWVEREWLLPDRTAAETAFSEIDLARARLIQDLRHGFGVNDEGVDIILHLLDQLHGVRSAVGAMRDGLGHPLG